MEVLTIENLMLLKGINLKKGDYSGDFYIPMSTGSLLSYERVYLSRKKRPRVHVHHEDGVEYTTLEKADILEVQGCTYIIEELLTNTDYVIILVKYKYLKYISGNTKIMYSHNKCAYNLIRVRIGSTIAFRKNHQDTWIPFTLEKSYFI